MSKVGMIPMSKISFTLSVQLVHMMNFCMVRTGTLGVDAFKVLLRSQGPGGTLSEH